MSNDTENENSIKYLPYLRYPGAKWEIADWIIQFFPPHRCYIELYAGSSACFFLKPPARLSVLNDLNGDIVNLFYVMREFPWQLIQALTFTPYARTEYEACEKPSEDPIERARRFLVRSWQAHGVRQVNRSGWSRSGVLSTPQIQTWLDVPERIRLVLDRLRTAEIESRPALRLLQDPNYAFPEVLWYVDPPYILSTRHERYYEHEMTEKQHEELLDVLNAHIGYVILSGYPHPLYDERLAHWGRVTKQVRTQSGSQKTEVLWLNPNVVYALSGRVQQLPLFGETITIV